VVRGLQGNDGGVKVELAVIVILREGIVDLESDLRVVGGGLPTLCQLKAILVMAMTDPFFNSFL
jgi:hypothetical protein